MRGTVIVVSHNSSQYIEACLRPLVGAPGWNVVVVDNASGDDSVARATRAAPDARVLRQAQNLGYAGAANLAASLSDADILLMLNPDVIAAQGALQSIVQGFSHDRVGAVAGMLSQPDGSPQRGFSVRRFPTLLSALADLFLLNRIWPLNPWNRDYRALDFDYSKVQEIEQPAGACLAISRAAWQDVQGMDDGFYPVWFEDVDLCRRLHDRGWKILYSPSAVFVHAGGHSVNQLPFPARQALWYGNLMRYFVKHEPRWKCFIVRIGIVAGLFLRCTASAFGSGPPEISVPEAIRVYSAVALRYGLLGQITQPKPKR